MEKDLNLSTLHSGPSFASYGEEPGFSWYAFANYYDENFHRLTPMMLRQNEKVKNLSDLRSSFLDAINHCELFLRHCLRPAVFEKVKDFAPGGNEVDEFVDTVSRFFDTPRLQEKYQEEPDNRNLFRNRDVVIPIIYGDGDAMDFAREISKDLRDLTGCRSVIVLFLYRIKPNSRGVYPPSACFPSFTIYDFAAGIHMDSSKDLLSALADGLEDLQQKEKKYVANHNF